MLGRLAKERRLADKPTTLILDALARGVADPDGLPLFASKQTVGLFPATTLARAAAQRCQDDGYIRVASGSPLKALWTVTDKGVQFLLTQRNPRQVLEDFVRALETRHAQAGELVQAARQMQAGIESLKSAIAIVLPQLHAPVEPAPAEPTGPAIVPLLRSWSAEAAQDCPLPELYARLRATQPTLSIGQFHDALRALKEAEQIHLHPWTGPKYAMPQPEYALLAGHDIAYYASLRQAQTYAA